MYLINILKQSCIFIKDFLLKFTDQSARRAEEGIVLIAAGVAGISGGSCASEVAHFVVEFLSAATDQD